MREAKKWIKEVRGAVEAREEIWEEKDRVIFWKGMIYIPDSTVLREEIELITRNYWWPRLMDDVKRYVYIQMKYLHSHGTSLVLTL